jgi:hypothetical protein
MKTEARHKKGMDEPKNHSEHHLATKKRDQSAEKVLRLANDRPSFPLD